MISENTPPLPSRETIAIVDTLERMLELEAPESGRTGEGVAMTHNTSWIKIVADVQYELRPATLRDLPHARSDEQLRRIVNLAYVIPMVVGDERVRHSVLEHAAPVADGKHVLGAGVVETRRWPVYPVVLAYRPRHLGLGRRGRAGIHARAVTHGS